MSVIFRTLKKLKTESTGAGKGPDGRVHRKKFFAFNAARHSTPSVLLLLVLFIILGAGTLFGYFQLRDNNGKKAEAFSIPNIDIRQSTNAAPNDKVENTGKQLLNPAKPSALNSIEYRKPDAHHNRVEIKNPDPSPHPKARYAAIKKTTATSHIVSKNQDKEADKSSASQNSTALDVGKVFLSNAKKNTKIARLVADIQREMDRGDKDRIEKLFDELSMIRGQNNSYVLKLKAVWHMSKNEYEDAANLLKEVLSRNELDLEAGLNMAIVEIRTGKEQDAYRRLEKLQKSYPENIRLAEILQDLRRLFNGEKIQHLIGNNG
jgi:tetratricopeptide (TPR) repeat protein